MDAYWWVVIFQRLEVKMDWLGEKNYVPKLSAQTVEFLEGVVTSESLVFETGSGNSTVWFAKRAKRVVSLEDHDDWYKKVQKLLDKERLENVTMYFDVEYEKKPLRSILKKEDMILYDIVLHDGPHGKERKALLVKEVYHLVKLGGYLVLDDTDREPYKLNIQFLDYLGWEKTEIPFGYDAFGSGKNAVIYRRLK